MITVVNLKKLRLPLAVILIFLLITAIMIPVVKTHTGKAAVPTLGSEHTAAPILVIDAGHGGLDGGASAADGTLESTVNLQIALRMEQLAKLCGVRTVMTRTGEDLDYPDDTATIHAKKVWDQKSRVALINSTENAVLVSVHQNTYPDGRPSGSEVLYAKTGGSAEFAALAHANLVTMLNPENRRVAAPISDSIYLMKNVKCPAILVECGFLSNAAEAAKLKSDTYQKALATVLIASYMQYMNI